MEQEHLPEQETTFPRSGKKESPYGKRIEIEPQAKGKESEPFTEALLTGSGLQQDLRQNYTEHLKALENASMGMLEGVVRSARQGFHISLVLNISTFLLGLVIIIIGLISLFQSPEMFGRIIGVTSSLIGLILVISLLFWKGPLERMLGSVSNLAQINAISLGLAHRLNQIARVFVQKSLKEEMDTEVLAQLNEMVAKAVSESIKGFGEILPRETAEKQAQRMVAKLGIFSKRH